MPTGFPPQPTYPLSIDSDRTLFLVFNTSEAKTVIENGAWEEDIEIEPVAAEQEEIWADNGFANISGELFYYDAVEKNSDGKIFKFKRCARNIGGKQTKYNPVGTWVRGFVVAEHHNQLADATLAIESYLLELSDEIADLEAEPVCTDDAYCVDVLLDVTSEEESSQNSGCSGITINYQIVINGTFSSFNLDFGDGQSTSSAQSGTHTYAPGTRADPIVTVVSENCTVIQTPLNRSENKEVPQATEEIPFTIPIPQVPDFPNIQIPGFDQPPLLELPQIVFPCLDVAPISFNPPSITIEPPVISIVPPSFGPIPLVISVPSVTPASFIFGAAPVVFPATFTFGAIPSIVPATFTFGAAPSVAPATFTFGAIPSIVPATFTFGAAPSVAPATFTFGAAPSIVPATFTFGAAPSVTPATFTFGRAPSVTPATFTFGSAPSVTPATFTFGQAPSVTPATFTFGRAPSVTPATFTFGSAPSVTPATFTFGSAPSVTPATFTFGSAPSVTPATFTFGRAPSVTPATFTFGSAPSVTPATFTFGQAPSVTPATFTFGSAPSVTPATFTFGRAPSVTPATFTFGAAPSVTPATFTFGAAPSVTPATFTFGRAPSVTPATFTFGAAPDIPSRIAFENAPTVYVDWETSYQPGGALGIPEVSINWGPVPTLSCVVTVECASSGGGGGSYPFRKMGEDFVDDLSDEDFDIEIGDIGIPSEIKIAVPKFPDIKVNHDIPEFINVNSDLPKRIVLYQADPIPKEIRIVSESVMPSTINIDYSGMPDSIKVDASSIPGVIMLKSLDIPEKILVDGSSIPDTIKVVGIPESIEVKMPSEIVAKLQVPENLEIPLVYKGGPVPIQFDSSNLLGGDDQTCFALVPCNKK